MVLSIKTIASFTSNYVQDGETIITLFDGVKIFVGYSKSGETGPEYDVRLDVDYAAGSVTETVLEEKDDGVCRAGLKIFGMGLQTLRLAGYGEVGGHCPNQGHIMNLDDPNIYKCLCDGAANCNLTSNVAQLFYDPKTDKIIATGGCGGRWIWILDRNLNIVGKISESYIRNLNGGKIEIIPRDDEKVFVVIGVRGENYIRFGLVDVDDIIDNAASQPNVDELGSWEELVKLTSLEAGCWLVTRSNGKTIVFATTSGWKYYDPEQNSFGDAVARASPLTFAYYYVLDTTNKKHVIYDSQFTTTVIEIDDTDPMNTYDKATFWFSTATDNTNKIVKIKAWAIDGKVPVVEWDLENRKFRVVDLLTGTPFTVNVYLMWSRLQASFSWHGTLPYIANGQISEMSISDWTTIPNPPSRYVNVLYVVPKFIT